MLSARIGILVCLNKDWFPINLPHLLQFRLPVGSRSAVQLYFWLGCLSFQAVKSKFFEVVYFSVFGILAVLLLTVSRALCRWIIKTFFFKKQMPELNRYYASGIIHNHSSAFIITSEIRDRTSLRSHHFFTAWLPTPHLLSDLHLLGFIINATHPHFFMWLVRVAGVFPDLR